MRPSICPLNTPLATPLAMFFLNPSSQHPLFNSSSHLHTPSQHFLLTHLHLPILSSPHRRSKHYNTPAIAAPTPLLSPPTTLPPPTPPLPCLLHEGGMPVAAPPLPVGGYRGGIVCSDRQPRTIIKITTVIHRQVTHPLNIHAYINNTLFHAPSHTQSHTSSYTPTNNSPLIHLLTSTLS